MKIFVTGGAGYIGSHVALALGEAGHELLIYDNLSTGHAWAVLSGKLVPGDLADLPQLRETLAAFQPEAVIHFAASIQVEESVREPLLYYRNNVIHTLNLLTAMHEVGIHRLLYSSTAAVYGIPERIPVTEETPVHPINPYGKSKAIVESILGDLAQASPLQYIALRYFNVAGAEPQGRLGQAYQASTHLITRALKTALEQYDKLYLYGTDYPTPDGTCIRDYIHVDDLAAAHVTALDYLMSGGTQRVMNVGYGHGYSVREVITMVKTITGREFPVEETSRRPGDPPALVADSSRLRSATGWQPRYDDLAYIVDTAWKWEQVLQSRPLLLTT